MVYSWGRGEGGQLGLAFNLLTNEDGNLYLTTPKRIRANLEGMIVKQIACGDAHSLALLQNGKVFGWGYTNSGQLGLGITGDTLEGNPKYSSIQIREPVMVETFGAVNIAKVTFFKFIFVNFKKDLCWINIFHVFNRKKRSKLYFNYFTICLVIILLNTSFFHVVSMITINWELKKTQLKLLTMLWVRIIFIFK